LIIKVKKRHSNRLWIEDRRSSAAVEKDSKRMILEFKEDKKGRYKPGVND
jgi:hypothetical protein